MLSNFLGFALQYLICLKIGVEIFVVVALASRSSKQILSCLLDLDWSSVLYITNQEAFGYNSQQPFKRTVQSKIINISTQWSPPSSHHLSALPLRRQRPPLPSSAGVSYRWLLLSRPTSWVPFWKNTEPKSEWAWCFYYHLVRFSLHSLTVSNLRHPFLLETHQLRNGTPSQIQTRHRQGCIILPSVQRSSHRLGWWNRECPPEHWRRQSNVTIRDWWDPQRAWSVSRQWWRCSMCDFGIANDWLDLEALNVMWRGDV